MIAEKSPATVERQAVRMIGPVPDAHSPADMLPITFGAVPAGVVNEATTILSQANAPAVFEYTR